MMWAVALALVLSPGYEVVGDSIPEPLAGAVGDPARGREIVTEGMAERTPKARAS